jgi:hypothetical protein
VLEDSEDFRRKTNEEHEKWFYEFYPEGLEENEESVKLYSLWAWQEQERRLRPRDPDPELIEKMCQAENPQYDYIDNEFEKSKIRKKMLQIWRTIINYKPKETK